MKLPRRRFLHLAAGATALPAASRFAMAQAYPSRPVRLIAPFPAGGSIDLTARLIGQWLTDRLGQQVVIENRSGAAGNIGSETALNSPPDGYTLLLCSVANAISATLYDKLNYNFRDVAAVAGISRAPNVMVLHPSVPAATVPQFIAYAKANPGKINMASSGTGTSIHMSGELVERAQQDHGPAWKARRHRWQRGRAILPGGQDQGDRRLLRGGRRQHVSGLVAIRAISRSPI
jgi:tripartite-type tricarboxylate transporter receptor subunit TctC